MKLCTVCGNEIDDGATRCRYCESPQPTAGAGRRTKPKRIRTVNLKQDLPTVEEALARLDRELAAAQRAGVKLMRIIHGWGSSGTGGKIRSALRRHLRELQGGHRVRGFVAGDEYSDTGVQGRRLLSQYPDLKNSLRTDRANPGITFVEL